MILFFFIVCFSQFTLILRIQSRKENEMHNVKRYHLSEEAKARKAAKEANKIKNYKLLSSSLLEKKKAKVYTEDAFKETTDLLLINPEFYTIWNYRRDIITEYHATNLSTEDLVKLFEKELMLTLQQMKEYPKVYWLWNHRTWLLNNHPTGANWQFELQVVEKLLSVDSRNFHGWHYRRFIIERIENKTGQSMALKEFEYAIKNIEKDFSNFSAWHNRIKLMPILFEQKPTELFEDKLIFFKKELNLLQNAMYTDPEDQSIWVYLRWLLSTELFVAEIGKQTYLNILREQLEIVKELNQLEKDDNHGKDNTWCLKTIVYIEQLITKTTGFHELRPEINTALQTLCEIDPLRRNVYKEHISNPN